MYAPAKNIIDNNELKLFEELNHILEEQKNIDIASGYFNLGGFALVKEKLKGAENFRLLLGKTPSFEEGNSSHDLFDAFSKSVKKDLEKTEFNRDNDNTTDELIRFLKQDNVQVRLYKDSFLHGKAYIFDNIAIIGSSNFTYSGLGGNTSRGFNTELNSVMQFTEAQYLKNMWFERLWNLESTVDFKEQLIKILEASKFGNKTTPYEVYIKALFELEKESIEYRLNIDVNNESVIDLTEFQEDAVKRVYSRLNRYNGVIVADSVGLGKTWIAKKVIEEYGIFNRKGYIVVCPAQLRDNMWVPELRGIGLPDYIISQEYLSNNVDNIRELIRSHTERKPEDIELIVVDESHNFRNSLSNRWEALYSLIEECTTETNSPKLILLTATPINNSIWDLYYQIMLITRNNNTAFMKDNIPDLKEYFKDIEKSGDVSRLEILLNQIAIRRTRQYIKAKYPDATIGGKKITFPKRNLKSLNYKLNETYRGLYQEIADKIENDLNMAYYHLESKYKFGSIDDLEAGRMQGLAGIFKTVLLKRLESSVEAFRKSIIKQIHFLEIFKDFFFNREMLFTKTFFNKYINSETENIEGFNIEDYVDVDKISSNEVKEIDLRNYDVESFKKDLEEDIKILKELYEDTIAITPDKDAKLNTFKEKLYELSRDNNKIIVFSYFTDTLNYIYDEIIQDTKYLGKLDMNIEKIDGSTPPKRREKIVSTFMGETPTLEEEEIDIIFSTDVLSEGQNLQKAKYLINYDLHWNPTRMIQRAGRIDRLGSPFDEIEIYNFFPEDELEELLRLVGRLQSKIRDINDSIGLDASVLGETIQPKVFGTLKIMREGSEQEQEKLMNELEQENFGGSEKFWLPLKEFIDKNSLQLLQNLPYGIKSGLHKEGIKGVFYSFRYKTDDKFKDYHYWLLYDIEKKQWIEDKGEILDYIKCKEDTPRVFNEEIDIYKLYDEAVELIKSKFISFMAAQTVHENRENKMIRTIIDELFYFRQEYEYEYEDPETVQRIDDLLNKIDQIILTKKRMQDIRKIWRSYLKEEINFKKFLSTMLEYFEGKKVLSSQKYKPFKQENLNLVCIDVIS